ncbi:MAG: diphthine synthase [Candidatus ainarchaeum sp.]|nr:diphthine synthase [Candidatus ainarchaeum sp.]
MFYLIGIGLKPKQLTLEALEILKNCDQIFLEKYTSEYSEGLIKELIEIIGKKFKLLGREEIETNFDSALLSAKKNNIALMIFGNALTATTHIQLLIDAKEKGIKYKIIPGISITNTISESCLDEYKFGRTITICYHEKDYEPETFYNQILENEKSGLHTLCLLDIKKDEKPKRLMNCKEAIEVIEKISLKKNETIHLDYIALLGMSSEKQKIVFGREKIFSAKEINEIFPQTMIIPGKINEKEKEAIEKLVK